MKCQKCGAELVPGHLYCDICGAEFQIVPNFEPEIENSIAESLSDISETVENTISVKVTKLTSKVKTLKVPSFSLIFVFVFVISLILFLGYTKYTNSITYQNNQAINIVHQMEVPVFHLQKISDNYLRNILFLLVEHTKSCH